MTKNTLTTLAQLRPGDKFLLTQDPGQEWTKINADTLRKCKEVFDQFAVPKNGIIPKPFKGKTEVVYVGRSKKVII